MRQDWRCEPVDAVAGTMRVPGDKSISHRAVMLGALAEGTTEVSGFLEGEDCLATMRAFQAMGVEIVHHGAGRVTVHGAGLHGLRAPAAPLDIGNSGTSMRLLAGVLAGQAQDARIKELERENYELKRSNEILRKAAACPSGARPQTAEFMQGNKALGTEPMCKELSIAPSTYYRHVYSNPL